MKSDMCVIMFVKSAERGMVKSRLAASVGKDVALDLYKCFVSDLMEMLGQGGHAFEIFFYPPDARQELVQWLGDEHTLIPQKGNDLGDRMKSAFELVFSQGFHNALLIGSDIPDLPILFIDEALGALKDCDAVVGPSHDGGYYLISFKRNTFLPQVFSGITWGTPEVFEQTIRILRKANLTVHTLPAWRDIDTVDDLKALFQDSRNTPFAESKTIKYIENNRCDFL
jgi:rSAM/selenodomain-associated transferase 1